MKEPLPLATIQDAVLEFLRDREDIAPFGAQAVNAYIDEPRMTQDVDILSTRAAEFAEELRKHLADRFGMAARMHEVVPGSEYRIYQLRQPKNRHLADVRQVDSLPATEVIADVRVLRPQELIAMKVATFTKRREQPKGGTDSRDLKLLLLTFPDLKSQTGAVTSLLKAQQADEQTLSEWHRFATSEIEWEDENEI